MVDFFKKNWVIMLGKKSYLDRVKSFKPSSGFEVVIDGEFCEPSDKEVIDLGVCSEVSPFAERLLQDEIRESILDSCVVDDDMKEDEVSIEGGEVESFVPGDYRNSEEEFRRGVELDLYEDAKRNTLSDKGNAFDFLLNAEITEGVISGRKKDKLKENFDKLVERCWDEDPIEVFKNVASSVGWYFSGKSNLSSVLTWGGNCEARAKLILCLLEELLPDLPKKMQFFGDHVRVVVEYEPVVKHKNFYAIDGHSVDVLERLEMPGTAITDKDVFYKAFAGEPIEYTVYDDEGGHEVKEIVSDTFFDLDSPGGLKNLEEGNASSMEIFSSNIILSVLPSWLVSRFGDLSRDADLRGRLITRVMWAGLLMFFAFTVYKKMQRPTVDVISQAGFEPSDYGEKFFSQEGGPYLADAKGIYKSYVSTQKQKRGQVGFTKHIEEINGFGQVSAGKSSALSEFFVLKSGDYHAKAKFLISIISRVYPKAKLSVIRYPDELRIYVSYGGKTYLVSSGGVVEKSPSKIESKALADQNSPMQSNLISRLFDKEKLVQEFGSTKSKKSVSTFIDLRKTMMTRLVTKPRKKVKNSNMGEDFGVKLLHYIPKGYADSLSFSREEEINTQRKDLLKVFANAEQTGVLRFSGINQLFQENQVYFNQELNKLKGLKKLVISSLNVSRIDLSGLIDLEVLDISITTDDSNLETIVLPKGSKLVSISLNGLKRLKNFDLSGVEALKVLSLSGVGLQDLDLTKNKNLQDVTLFSMQNLVSVDLSDLKHLTKLYLSYNFRLTSADMRNTSALKGENVSFFQNSPNCKALGLPIGTLTKMGRIGVNISKLRNDIVDSKEKKKK